MEQHWWTDVFRGLFGMLDSIVYSFISIIYTLLVEIAHFRVFNDDTLNEFSARIYAILGIVMLFKLSFSFINYMINPDSFTDKEKGVQNIIKNIIVMFAMLIMCPWAFTKLWDIQAAILDDQILPRFVFGSVSANSSADRYIEDCPEGYVISNSQENAGEYMAIMVLRGFYQPYDSSDIKATDEYEDVVTLLCDASTEGVSNMLTNVIYNEYADIKWGWGGNTYIMEYKFGLSTVVGVVVLLLLVNFCMDAGVRMVKLSFLQLIAPIPIVSYIDPASGKNGIFKKWLKEVGSTWVSLFIRLLAVFFAVSIIQHVGDLVPVGDDQTREASIFVQIFVIIGALMFAKQLPGLIQNITGIKMDGGGFNLNPLKKMENDMLVGGKALSNGIRKTAGFAGRTAKTVGALPFAAVKGLGKGFDNLTGNKISGTKNAARAKVQSVKDAAAAKRDAALKATHLDGAYNRLTRDMSGIGNDARYTLYGMVGGVPGAKGLMTGKADKMDKRIQEYDSIINNIDSMMKRANGEMIKHNDIEFNNSEGNAIRMSDFKDAKKQLAVLTGMDTSRMSDAERLQHSSRLNKLETYVNKTEKLAEQAYIDAVRNGGYTDSSGARVELKDAQISTTYDDVVRMVATSSDATVRSIDTTNGAGLKKGKDNTTDAKTTMQKSPEYKSAQARKAAAPK